MRAVPLLKGVFLAIILFNCDHINAVNDICHGLPFNKVVIWGYKLHSHTHSYIHWAFYRAFKSLGYTTYWLDNKDDIKNIDISHALFITASGADIGIPIRDDCFYILHNCDLERFKRLLKDGHCIVMQVYTHDCLKRQVTYLDDYIWYDIDDKVLYMPWATDLLPGEIDKIKNDVPNIHRNNSVCFVGSKWGGWQGNAKEMCSLERACADAGLQFNIVNKVDLDEHIRMIQTALLAPSIQGKWQCDNGYIPCRIFKNISYGQIGMTNSETVYKLFHKKIIYNSDPYRLLFEGLKKRSSISIQEQCELMDFVRDKHTYINRIDSLLQFFSLVSERAKGQKLIWQAVMNDTMYLTIS